MSPLIKPDTSQVGEIEAGTWPGTILKHEVKKSKNGTLMLVPSCEVKATGKTKTIDAYVMLEGPGAFRFIQLLRACGLDKEAAQYEDPNVNPKPDFDTDRLNGAVLNFIVEHELYDGAPRAKISGFLKQ